MYVCMYVCMYEYIYLIFNDHILINIFFKQCLYPSISSYLSIIYCIFCIFTFKNPTKKKWINGNHSIDWTEVHIYYQVHIHPITLTLILELV